MMMYGQKAVNRTPRQTVSPHNIEKYSQQEMNNIPN